MKHLLSGAQEAPGCATPTVTRHVVILFDAVWTNFDGEIIPWSFSLRLFAKSYFYVEVTGQHCHCFSMCHVHHCRERGKAGTNHRSSSAGTGQMPAETSCQGFVKKHLYGASWLSPHEHKPVPGGRCVRLSTLPTNTSVKLIRLQAEEGSLAVTARCALAPLLQTPHPFSQSLWHHFSAQGESWAASRGDWQPPQGDVPNPVHLPRAEVQLPAETQVRSRKGEMSQPLPLLVRVSLVAAFCLKIF